MASGLLSLYELSLKYHPRQDDNRDMSNSATLPYATKTVYVETIGSLVYVSIPGFTSASEAEECQAAFPKGARLIAQPFESSGGVVRSWWLVNASTLRLNATTANGGTNEAGIRRLETIMVTAANLGMDIEETWA